MATNAVRFDLIGRDRASGAFDRVGKKMTALEKLSGKVGHAIKAGLMAGTAAVAGLGAVSVKSAVDFQASMTRISTQAGGTRKDVKVLGDQVLKLGGKVQQGPQQLAEALYHLKSVGMDNVDAMKALRTASDLAAVGGSDLEETTNALAGAWRTGIKGATSFGEAAATVNAIIGAGNMTLGQFTEALSSGILPTAKTFGLTLKQVGAALALFTDEGVPAADAATRLRMSISLLGAPSAAAEKQLKKIGLTGLDLARAMRGKDGIIGAIQLLKDHLDASGLSAAEQSQLLSRAFGGGRSSAGILALINNLDVLKQKQDQVNTSTGKYADAVKQQRKTAEAEWKRLVGGLQTGAVRLGTVLLPPLTDFVGYINDELIPAAQKVGSHLADLIPMDKVKASLKDAEGVIGDFLKGLTGISTMPSVKMPLPALKAPQIPKGLLPGKSQAEKFGETIRTVSVQLAKDLKPLADASLGIGKAFVSIATHTPAPVLQRIAEVMIATSITKRVIGLAAAFRGLAVSMAESWTAAAGPVGVAAAGVFLLATAFSAASGRGSSLGDTLSFLKDAIVGPYGIVGAVKAIGKAFVWVFSPTGGLSKQIGRFNHWLAEKGEEVVHGFVKGVKTAWHSFTGFFTTTLPNELVGWVEQGFGIASPSKVMMPVGANVVRGFLSGALGVAKTIGGWIVDHVITPVVSRFAQAGSWLVGKGRSLVSGFKNGIVKVAGTIGRWITDHVISPVTGRFKNVGSWLKSKGGQLISGLKAGIVEKMKTIGDWIKTNVVDPVVKAVKKFFGIKSPSTVFAGIGGHLVGGLLKGLSIHSGTSIAKKVFGDLPHALTAIVKKGLVSVTSLPGEALKALGGLGGDLLGLLGLGGSGSGSSKNQQIGKLLAATQGWSGPQWTALQALWTGESGWNEKALNASSGAYGIPQALPASKMASAGSDWKTNPSTQIKWGLGYIKSRYGDPLSAYSAWLSRSPHWYDQGGLAKGTGYMAKNTLRPERVLSPAQTRSFDRLVELLDSGRIGGGSDIHVHFDDDRLRNLIDVQVKPKIKQSEDRQAYRAKVGRR